MIKAEKIFKSFDDLEVLKGIDFIFEQGKTNLIIGKSGAGKTVLLKILVGLYPPTSGKVLYGDTDLFSLPKNKLRDIRMRVGMLFQGNALFDSMTIEENIRFPIDMFTTLTLKEKRSMVDKCLERVELMGINNKYPSEISGGMQKRVGIARAIVFTPEFLFCDEPNSGLDPKTAITIDELITSITKEYNMTTIINTHDMNSVMEIGEKICFLENGFLAWEGKSTEVLTSKSQVLENFIFASPFLQRLKSFAVDKTDAIN